jgi:iron(III) transport system permease protein
VSEAGEAASKRRASGRGLAAILAGLLLWVVGYPLLITVVEALGGASGPTLRHFLEFASRVDEWQALVRSGWISVASVALAALLGVPLGFIFERTDFPGRRLLGALVALPVALPPLVGVIAFLFLYGESGLLARNLQRLGLDVEWQLGGAGAILLVHAYSMYVYFYLFTRAGLARLDAALYEAAASLGARPPRVLWRITLPLLQPALAGAALLVFMTALASFSAPYIFGGSFRVMTTQIVASKLNGELHMAYVETVMLGLLALVGLFALRRIDRGRTLHVSERGIAPARVRVERRAARLAAALAGWGLAIALLLPHATLILISLVPPNTWTVEAFPPVLRTHNYGVLLTELERLRPMLNSLWMASAATLGALVVGFLGARASLRVRGALGGLLELLLALPWAIPGTVFAIALATSFSVHSPLVGRVVLVGTAWILPLAYLVRSLPMTGRAAFAGLRQLDPSLEEAAASLGASPRRALGRVVLPLLRPALAAGAGLAFVTGLGDFVTSIVLYTYRTRPISIEILSSLRLQETGVAAAYGVLLMVVSAGVFLVWARDPHA